MKKIIMLFNTAEEYSAFYKRYTAKGIEVSVVAGLELALSINIADVGNYDLDFYSNEECEKQHQDSLTPGMEVYLLQQRINARIYGRKGQSPVTQIIEVAAGETRTFVCNEKGDPITVETANYQRAGRVTRTQLVWVKDERFEAQPSLFGETYRQTKVEKEWVLSKDGTGAAYLILTQVGKYWLIPFDNSYPQELDSTQVAFINTQNQPT